MVDILVIAAHPDDIELHVSGTLLRCADMGGSFALCDLTRGERGTRGTAETRRLETVAANEVLGISDSMRWNLDMPDGSIRLTGENILKVVQTIRYFRPDILLYPSSEDRHPDHGNAGRLVAEAWFNAGLAGVPSEFEGHPQEPHRPPLRLTFDHAWESEPDIIIDITDQFERKLKAIASYGTQFRLPDMTTATAEGPETFISTPAFMEYMMARMRRYGFMVGAAYGEAFHRVGTPLRIDDLRTLV